MSPWVLHFARLSFILIPETRLFRFKVFLLRLAGVKIGYDVRVCSSVQVIGSGELSVGEGSWVGHEVLICATSSVWIGSAVDIGPRVYIGTGTHEIALEGVRAAGLGVSKDICIGDGSWIGAGSLILPGVTVGRNAIVAAGSVVIRDVPDGATVGGVPARVLR